MAFSSTGMYEGASLDSELDIFSFVLIASYYVNVKSSHTCMYACTVASYQ